MHHPLWPDHHGKRVWGGSIPSTDSEYVKLFNQAAGAPSQKEALEAPRRFCEHCSDLALASLGVGNCVLLKLN